MRDLAVIFKGLKGQGQAVVGASGPAARAGPGSRLRPEPADGLGHPVTIRCARVMA
jgi:hypothetical protein